MKFLSTELKKLLTLRIAVILFVAIAANFLLFWHGQARTHTQYNQSDYHAAQQELLDMAEAERAEFAREHQRMLNACLEWQHYDEQMQRDPSRPGQITEEMLLYRNVYESGGYLRYTDSVYAERALYNRLFSEYGKVRDYHTVLKDAIEEARRKTSVSIFAKPGTFAYRSQLAIIDQFEKLLEVEPVYDRSEGVLKLQTSAFTDLIGLVLILLLSTEIVVSEHRTGMLHILRATRKGRLPLIASKIAAVWVLALFTTLVLWGVNFAYCAGNFGFGDLSRPVQSLSGYTTCALILSVGEFLLLQLLTKWLLYTLAGVLCLFAGLVFRSAMTTWLVMGGFLSVEYLLSQISTISAWNALKYINISNMIFTADWLSEYRNLNFFGYPVDAFAVSVSVLAGLLAAGMPLVCWFFCRRKVQILPKLKLRLSWPKWLPRPGRSTFLFGHEMWKLLIECGTLTVLAIFLVINLQAPKVVAYDTDELYYKNYMQMLEGPLNEESMKLLEEETRRYDDLRAQIAQLRKDSAEGKISRENLELLIAPLNRALEGEKVLKGRIYPQIERVKKLTEEGKQAWLVYEPGYEYLFGLDTYHDKAASAALMLAGIILCFANFYPLEISTGMLPLLNVYARGRSVTAWNKIAASAVITVILFLIAQIPDYWYVIRNYGFPALHGPMCSIAQFSGWSDGISLLGGILIYEGLRLMTALVLTMIVLLICLWTRNQLAALCGSTGALLLPLLLHLLELEFLDSVSFYLPITGTGLIRGETPLPLGILYYGAVLLIGCLCVWQIIRITGRGEMPAGHRKRA